MLCEPCLAFDCLFVLVCGGSQGWPSVPGFLCSCLCWPIASCVVVCHYLGLLGSIAHRLACVRNTLSCAALHCESPQYGILYTHMTSAMAHTHHLMLTFFDSRARGSPFAPTCAQFALHRLDRSPHPLVSTVGLLRSCPRVATSAAIQGHMNDLFDGTVDTVLCCSAYSGGCLTAPCSSQPMCPRGSLQVCVCVYKQLRIIVAPRRLAYVCSGSGVLCFPAWES